MGNGRGRPVSQAEGEPAFPPCGGRSGEGVGHPCLRQGDVPRAGPVLAPGRRRGERLPRATSGRLTASALGDASALAGRVAEALPRRERGLEHYRQGYLSTSGHHRKMQWNLSHAIDVQVCFWKSRPPV